MIEEIIIKPIGVVRSDLRYRYETPRQGILAGGSVSIIELNPDNNFEQAIKDLDGFERIWVLYQFHLNKNWKPLVSPPRHTRKKVGVFASRAPYRPNQIGMSCVRLGRIEGLKIFISESDILDGTPVIDIKPYLPYSDSFPDASTGWAAKGIENIYEVAVEPLAEAQCKWLKEMANINLIDFTRLQLEFAPTDSSRKRIEEHVKVTDQTIDYILSYRTWRIYFSADEENKKVTVREIRSGYSRMELHGSGEDKYKDKTMHLNFEKQFSGL